MPEQPTPTGRRPTRVGPAGQLQVPVPLTDPAGTGSAGQGGSTTPTAGRGRFLAGGALSGLLGGLCCIGGAVAVGLGLGGAGFFATLMDRYQGLFIAASLALMTGWLLRTASAAGLRGAGRVLARQAVVMGGVYVVTLALTLPLGMLVKR